MNRYRISELALVFDNYFTVVLSSTILIGGIFTAFSFPLIGLGLVLLGAAIYSE